MKLTCHDTEIEPFRSYSPKNIMSFQIWTNRVPKYQIFPDSGLLYCRLDISPASPHPMFHVINDRDGKRDGARLRDNAFGLLLTIGPSSHNLGAIFFTNSVCNRDLQKWKKLGFICKKICHLDLRFVRKILKVPIEPREKHLSALNSKGPQILSPNYGHFFPLEYECVRLKCKLMVSIRDTTNLQ